MDSEAEPQARHGRPGRPTGGWPNRSEPKTTDGRPALNTTSLRFKTLRLIIHKHTPRYSQDTSVDMSASELMETKEADVKAMRAIVSDAVLLLAKKLKDIDASCFHEKDTDWQLALSEAILMRDHPELKNCSESEAVFFIRMTEIMNARDQENKMDPRVFVAPVIGTPNTANFFLHYTIRFWGSVAPGWRGSDRANGRSNQSDVSPISMCIMECLEEAMFNQMPPLDAEGTKGGAED